MKKKYLIIIGIVLVVVLLVPIPIRLKDGGSIEFKSLLYKITKVNRLNHNAENGYDKGVTVELFGRQIFSSVPKEKFKILTKEVDNKIIRLTVPVEWTFVDMPEDKNGKDDFYKYAVKFYKSDKDQYIVFHYNGFVGLCGTGRTSKRMTLNNGEKASVGYQDGHWSDIVFLAQDGMVFFNWSLGEDEFTELVEIAKTLTVETKENKNEHSFFASITEAHKKYLIVKPYEDSEERKSSDKIKVDLPSDNTQTYTVGSNVKITYNGIIKESYPAMISAIKIEEKSADNIEIKFTSKPGEGKKRIIDKRKNKKYEYNVYLYDGDAEIVLDKKTYSLEKALTENKITMLELLIFADVNCEERLPYDDGGSREYHFDDYTIIKCNTLDGNRDVYIGGKDLELSKELLD